MGTSGKYNISQPWLDKNWEFLPGKPWYATLPIRSPISVNPQVSTSCAVKLNPPWVHDWPSFQKTALKKRQGTWCLPKLFVIDLGDVKHPLPTGETQQFW